MRTALLVLGVSALRLCAPNVAVEPSGNNAPSAATVTAAEHGGALVEAPGLEAEVVSGGAGAVRVYLRDAEGAALEGAVVEVALRRPDGSSVPVLVHYDARERAYVGAAVVPEAASYPVELRVRPNANAPWLTVESAPVVVVPPTVLEVPASAPPPTVVVVAPAVAVAPPAPAVVIEAPQPVVVAPPAPAVVVEAPPPTVVVAPAPAVVVAPPVIEAHVAAPTVHVGFGIGFGGIIVGDDHHHGRGHGPPPWAGRGRGRGHWHGRGHRR